MEHQTVTLKGVVERITYTNPDNGYTIARFQAGGRFGLVTLVGALAEVHPGARLKVEGRWKTHPKYGEQFEIIRYVEEMPATTEGIKRYLGSGLIKGIGPKMARRIAEHFGAYTLDVIENEIYRLNEVDGIGHKRVRMIAQAWEAQKQIKEIMIFLQGHQVSTTLAVKIYKTYGDNAIQIVKETPYRLARDIYGIGFLTADKIARSLGIEPDAPQRVAAGIEYTLNQLADQGHVYAPRDHLIEAAVKILDVMANQARFVFYGGNTSGRPDGKDSNLPFLQAGFGQGLPDAGREVDDVGIALRRKFDGVSEDLHGIGFRFNGNHLGTRKE